MVPSCCSIHSITIFKASKSSVGSLFSNSFSIFTFNELFVKSITIGLLSSGNGLFSSNGYIALPSCCKYNILEFSSNALNHIIPSIPSICKPSFALFITTINFVLSELSDSKFSNSSLFLSLLYPLSNECNCGTISVF